MTECCDARKTCDELTEAKWGSSISPPDPNSTSIKDETADAVFDECVDADEAPRAIPETEEPTNATGRLINQQPVCDQITNAEVQLQNGNAMLTGVVR